MSERIKRNLPVIKRLKRMNVGKRKKFLKVCNQDMIDCLCETSKNILRGNLPISSACLKKLRRYKKTLREISTKKTAASKRRALLVQRGGFLPLILGPLLGLASSAIGGAINKALGQWQ